MQLHLVGSPTRAAGTIDPSAHHVCFGVDDLETAVGELERAGIAYVRGSQNQHGVEVAQIFVVDPAGNVIELQDDKG